MPPKVRARLSKTLRAANAARPKRSSPTRAATRTCSRRRPRFSCSADRISSQSCLRCCARRSPSVLPPGVYPEPFDFAQGRLHRRMREPPRRRRLDDEPSGGLPLFPLILVVVLAGLLLGGVLAHFFGGSNGASSPGKSVAVAPQP